MRYHANCIKNIFKNMKYYQRVCIGFDKESKDALDEIVEAQKTTRSQLFRTLFLDYYNSHKSELLNSD